MQKVLRVGIDKPCGENWAKFPKQRDGFVLKGHCASCNKNVIDFTTWSDERIRDYFSSKPVDVCGRLRSSQLKDYQLQKKQRKSFQYFYGLLLTALLSFTSKLTEAQVREKPVYATQQFNTQFKKNRDPLNEGVAIRGTVLSAEDESKLPGVNVFVKGTSNGTVTDIEGRFELWIDNPRPSETLVFAFIGLQTQEVAINTQNLIDDTTFKMSLDIVMLGDVTGGISYCTISPRRWWWKFKGLFSGYRW